MGWLDYHLHHFEMNHSIEKGKQYMGIPDNDGFDDFLNTLPGWGYRFGNYLGNILEFFLDKIES